MSRRRGPPPPSGHRDRARRRGLMRDRGGVNTTPLLFGPATRKFRRGLVVFGISTRILIAPSGTPHWTQESETALLSAPAPGSAPSHALVGTRARAPSGGPWHQLRRTGSDNWCSICRAESMLSACLVELHARVPPMTRWARTYRTAGSLSVSSLISVYSVRGKIFCALPGCCARTCAHTDAPAAVQA